MEYNGNMTIRRPLYFISAACAAAVLIKFYFGTTIAAGVCACLGLLCIIEKRAAVPTGSRSARPRDQRALEDLGGSAGPYARATGAEGSAFRAVLTMILIAYVISFCNILLCDQRLAADPLLKDLEQEVTITGIVKDPEIHTDSHGRLMLRIDTEVRLINGKEVRPGLLGSSGLFGQAGSSSRLLLTVPAEEAAGRTGDQDRTSTFSDSRSSGKTGDSSNSGKTGDSSASGKTGDASADGQVSERSGAAHAQDPALIYEAMTTALPGSVIRFTGTPKQPDPKRNPNCFDYRLYLKSKGIQATVRCEHIQVLAPSERAAAPTIAGRLFLMREKYLARIGMHTGPETEYMMRAILFGEKGLLGDEVQEVFRQNGTAHVLAVSGLHVGMIYGAVTLIWDLLARLFPHILGARKGRRFFICMAAFFTGYAFLAGFSPSVVRAVCMVLLHALAFMTGRRYDLNCAAFAVGTVALLHNPYIIFQAGFQMSFLAILTLGLITPYIHRIYSGALAGSIAIQIGLGPYMASQFNVLPMLAILINVPVIFLTGILVPAGIFGMMLPAALPAAPGVWEHVMSATPGVWGHALSGLTGIWDNALASLCEMMVRMNELCRVERVTSMTCASPPIGLLAAYYLGLLVFASEEGRRLFLRGRKRMLQKLAVGVLIASLAFGQAADDGFRHAQMVFVDVGQGDCMHIRCGRGNFLIDGGGSKDYEVGTKTLKPYLLKNGESRVDGAFVTHLHTDHYQGICELAKAGMVRRLFLYDGNRVKEAQVCEETGLQPSQLTYLSQGQRVELPGGGSVEVLWPKKKTASEYERMVQNEEDENASSLIIRVEVNGVSMLATGDLGEEGEAQLLREEEQLRECGGGTLNSSAAGGLHSDILKVGHHGSKTSSSEAFLDAVDPAVAVIQVGKNNMYGHPTPETLERLADRGIPVYRNDLQGAVGLRLKDGAVKQVKTMITDPTGKTITDPAGTTIAETRGKQH